VLHPLILSETLISLYMPTTFFFLHVIEVTTVVGDTSD